MASIRTIQDLQRQLLAGYPDDGTRDDKHYELMQLWATSPGYAAAVAGGDLYALQEEFLRGLLASGGIPADAPDVPVRSASTTLEAWMERITGSARVAAVAVAYDAYIAAGGNVAGPEAQELGERAFTLIKWLARIAPADDGLVPEDLVLHACADACPPGIMRGFFSQLLAGGWIEQVEIDLAIEAVGELTVEKLQNEAALGEMLTRMRWFRISN